MTEKEFSELVAAQQRQRRAGEQLSDKRDLSGTKKRRRELPESRETELRETRGGLGQKNHHRGKVEKKV